MKIAVIQSGYSGFFPRFYNDLSSSAMKVGDEIRLFLPNTGRNRRANLSDSVLWGTKLNWFVHYNIFKWIGIQDCYSHISTFDLIRKLKSYNPEVIHLHVVNEWILNIPMFVKYVNKKHIKVVWTMHDCRAFTGRCAYFDEVNCERWLTGCGKCPQRHLYSPSKIDNSAWQWRFRERWLTKLENLYIVTPSSWLATFVERSYLGSYPVKVIYNGINTKNFANECRMNIKERFNIQGKKIILGVAANWEFRKGLQYFELINSRKRADEEVVLIGSISDSDRERIEDAGIICVGRTSSIDEMKAWYQAASVFVNPTLADNFPTTNIESLASGTPVVTFITGGSAEAIDEHCGIAVEKGNGDDLIAAIRTVMDNPDDYTPDNCYLRSQCFSLMQFDKYVELYHKL